MLMGIPRAPQWNIFARELAKLMSVHGLKLSHLYNRQIVYYPEIVRRLQQSLDRPGRFPILNPEELDRLISALHLTPSEENQLKAAIVATSIERTLMDRINQDAALQAADDVFHIVFDALESRTGPALSHIKGGVFFVEPEIPDDPNLDTALDLIDRATIALYASKDASTPRVRVTTAREADDTFYAALMLLEGVEHLSSTTRSPDSDEKEHWRHQTRLGREMAQSLMKHRETDDI